MSRPKTYRSRFRSTLACGIAAQARSTVRGLWRALLWHFISAAVAVERAARQPARRRPTGGGGRRESSQGRFLAPCSSPALDQDDLWFPGRPGVPRATNRWRTGAIAGIAGFAFLGGVLVRTVRSGIDRRLSGQAAVAGSTAPGPARISSADRAALARCAAEAKAPLRPDTMSAQRRSEAEAGSFPWVVRHGSSSGRLVSLTFDDGPNPGTTPRILAALRRESVPATFFVIGANVEQQPELARQLLAEGHAIGNHTWHHLFLDHLDRDCTNAEMEVTSRLIENVTGYRPAWFRPPGGYYTDDVLRSARQLGQRVVLWSQDARDWSSPGQDTIRRRVLAGVKPGAIILLHDTSPQTAAVLPRLLRQVKARGYRFVPLAELVPGQNPSPEPDQASRGSQ
jgi:peptidoglycan/xylan/chitin deacetylase (PgdA/CDA1 family)